MNKTLLWASVLVTVPMYAAAVENLPTTATWNNTKSTLTVSWETQPQATTYGVCYGKLEATDAVTAQQEVDSKSIMNASDCDNWRKVNGLQNGLTIKGMTVGNFYYVKTFAYSETIPLAESEVILVETGSVNSSGRQIATATTSPCTYRVDWSNRNMSGADLHGAYLYCFNLYRANLSVANLGVANLSYAILSYANLGVANLRSANLSYANLSYAGLGSADLRSANLTGADLSHASLGANLTGANLTGADLRYANLRYANLTSAILTNIKCDSTTIRPDGTNGCP